MSRKLHDRLKKLEGLTIKGNSLWWVYTDGEDRWLPTKIMTQTGKEVERLETMTAEQFFQWKSEGNKKPFIDLVVDWDE